MELHLLERAALENGQGKEILGCSVGYNQYHESTPGGISIGDATHHHIAALNIVMYVLEGQNEGAAAVAVRGHGNAVIVDIEAFKLVYIDGEIHEANMRLGT